MFNAGNNLITDKPAVSKFHIALKSLEKLLPWNLWRPTKSLLAIDLNSSDIKLMSMSKVSNAYRIDYYAVVSLPFDTALSNPQENTQSAVIVSALQRVLQRTGQKNHWAITSLMSAQTINKKVLVDNTTDPAILDVLIEEASLKVLPYKLDEISLDYVCLGSSKTQANKMEVILVAAQTKHVAERVELIEQAGLEVKILDIDSYAIARALTLMTEQIPQKIYNEGIIAVIDIGAKNTGLNVLLKQVLLYAHQEAFGGDQLTQAIMQHYNLSHEQAELAKENNNLPNEYYQELFEPFRKMLVEKISELLQFFYAATNYTKIDFVILTGGGALTKGLAERLGEALNIPTIIADPCANLRFKSTVNEVLVKQTSPALMTLLGLAMRGAA